MQMWARSICMCFCVNDEGFHSVTHTQKPELSVCQVNCRNRARGSFAYRCVCKLSMKCWVVILVENHTQTWFSLSPLLMWLERGLMGSSGCVCVYVPWSAVCAAWPARACLWRAAADSGRAPSWPPPDLHTLRLAPHTAAAAPPSGPRRAASPAATHMNHTHESHTRVIHWPISVQEWLHLQVIKSCDLFEEIYCVFKSEAQCSLTRQQLVSMFQSLTVNDPLELHLHQLWDAQTHHEKHWLTEKTLGVIYLRENLLIIEITKTNAPTSKNPASIL